MPYNSGYPCLHVVHTPASYVVLPASTDSRYATLHFLPHRFAAPPRTAALIGLFALTLRSPLRFFARLRFATSLRRSVSLFDLALLLAFVASLRRFAVPPLRLATQHVMLHILFHAHRDVSEPSARNLEWILETYQRITPPHNETQNGKVFFGTSFLVPWIQY